MTRGRGVGKSEVFLCIWSTEDLVLEPRQNVEGEAELVDVS